MLFLQAARTFPPLQEFQFVEQKADWLSLYSCTFIIKMYCPFSTRDIYEGMKVRGWQEGEWGYFLISRYLPVKRNSLSARTQSYEKDLVLVYVKSFHLRHQ